MSLFDTIRSAMSGAQSTESDTGASPKMENSQDQPQRDQDLAGFIKSRVEESRSHATRVSAEGVWMTNIAYLVGFDSVYYDPTLRQFKPINREAKFVRRNRVHNNLILPAAQNRLARMLKNPPKYEVRPNSDEQEDKDAAQLGEELIGVIWDKQHINRKRIDMGMWLQQCGHSYMKITWDDQIGEAMIDPESGEMLGYEGDIRVEPVSALEVFPDPLAKSFDELSWIAHCKVRKLDYFQNHYPERGDMVKEEGAWLLSSQYEARINSMNTMGPANSGASEQMRYSAIEISYYEKRSKRYQNGRHIIVANGVLLKNDSLPCGEIPFAKFDDIVVGGKYYSEAAITHARPLQDQYNTALSKRGEWVRRLLAGKFIAAKGHGLAQEALNNESGEVVEYDPVPGAQEPHAMQIPVMPQYVYTETQDLETQLNQKFGLSDVSQGKLPSASIPGIGIQLLLEQDATRLGIEVEQHEHAFARVGMLILKLAGKNYMTDRDIKIKDNNARLGIKKVSGESLKRNFDVTVIRGSTTPNNKALHRQDLMNAYQSGLLGDPHNPEVQSDVWDKMEFGEVKGTWTERRLDLSQIQKTISQIENGIVPDVNRMDNHALHIVMKNRYRKSEKWDTLADELKQLLLQDIEAHLQAAVSLAHPELDKPPTMPPPPIPQPLPGQPAPGMGAPPPGPQNAPPAGPPGQMGPMGMA